ncbi:PLDc N-terminal domain-containing protein [Roseivirga misakiensis]|uniref:Cardiolipin synthase N-terminal domain-containing protein n=1 Tax=Roseivirga misakiensis TaxID=1563681 RepID=A0A1E5T0G3_9BACT|nr:PLDc N-terminal domain-containing protein [Roseivirga misakiensis]OEK04797.1 hypothetical protein BFP71_15240 [Roseivirga misakiensis]
MGPASATVFFVLYGIPAIIIISALISVLKSEFKVEQNKLIWVIVVIVLPVLGALLYFAIGRSQRIQLE